MQIKLANNGKGHLAVDFDSKNGVFINDKKIMTDTPLNDHDAIKIGDTLLIYHLDDEYDAKGVHHSLKRFCEGHVGTQTF